MENTVTVGRISGRLRLHIRSPAAERLLRAIAEKSPDRALQARATLHLAQLLKSEAELVRRLKQNQAIAKPSNPELPLRPDGMVIDSSCNKLIFSKKFFIGESGGFVANELTRFSIGALTKFAKWRILYLAGCAGRLRALRLFARSNRSRYLSGSRLHVDKWLPMGRALSRRANHL
jgi:hypothetical protein